MKQQSRRLLSREERAGSGRSAGDALIGRHIGDMPKLADKVTFDIKPIKEGSGWYIVATYPGGMQEHIPGFKNEAEAQAWLKGNGRQMWLGARGYAQ
jgi:oxalate decarboxylase/phosphoglucose isomerase-like protein (cupin superfamily)